MWLISTIIPDVLDIPFDLWEYIDKVIELFYKGDYILIDETNSSKNHLLNTRYLNNPHLQSGKFLYSFEHFRDYPIPRCFFKIIAFSFNSFLISLLLNMKNIPKNINFISRDLLKDYFSLMIGKKSNTRHIPFSKPFSVLLYNSPTVQQI
jgi:hypothetical protein